MARITLCPQCKAKYNTAKLPSGRRFTCKKCGTQCMTADETTPGVSESNMEAQPTPIAEPSDGAAKPREVISESIPPRIGGCRLMRKLGQGGMGAVYLAHHERLDTEVAIKILPQALAMKSPKFVERFIKEARLAAKLRHPNVVQVLDVGEDRGYHFAIQEYVDGGSLSDQLRQRGALPEAMLWEVLDGVAHALEAAAEVSIIHRDIKPDNIMLTQRGQVKLSDLGLAKQTEQGDVSMTMSAATLGTPLYMPPEQAKDAKNADQRSDYYALGATVYHLATGTPPYQGKSAFDVMMKHAQAELERPRKRNPDLPAGLESLILFMMNKAPEERPQTIAELLQAIDEAKAGRVVGHGEAKAKSGPRSGAVFFDDAEADAAASPAASGAEKSGVQFADDDIQLVDVEEGTLPLEPAPPDARDTEEEDFDPTREQQERYEQLRATAEEFAQHGEYEQAADRYEMLLNEAEEWALRLPLGELNQRLRVLRARARLAEAARHLAAGAFGAAREIVDDVQALEIDDPDVEADLAPLATRLAAADRRRRSLALGIAGGVAAVLVLAGLIALLRARSSDHQARGEALLEELEKHLDAEHYAAALDAAAALRADHPDLATEHQVEARARQATAWVALGTARATRDRGQLKQALGAYESLLEDHAGSAAAQEGSRELGSLRVDLCLAQAAGVLEKGDLDGALALLARELERTPDGPDRARLLHEQEACRTEREAATLLAKALAAMAQKRYAEAAEYFEVLDESFRNTSAAREGRVKRTVLGTEIDGTQLLRTVQRHAAAKEYDAAEAALLRLADNYGESQAAREIGTWRERLLRERRTAYADAMAAGKAAQQEEDLEKAHQHFTAARTFQNTPEVQRAIAEVLARQHAGEFLRHCAACGKAWKADDADEACRLAAAALAFYGKHEGSLQTPAAEKALESLLDDATAAGKEVLSRKPDAPHLIALAESLLARAPDHPGVAPLAEAHLQATVPEAVLHFDGDDGWVELPALPALAGAAEVTLEAWVRPNLQGVDRTFTPFFYSLGPDGEHTLTLWAHRDGALSLAMQGVPVVRTPAGMLRSGALQHIGVHVAAGGSSRVCIDSRAAASGRGPAHFVAPTTAFLGKGTSYRHGHWAGELVSLLLCAGDSLAWRTTASLSPPADAPPALLAYSRFDGMEDRLVDRTGQGHDGRLHGVEWVRGFRRRILSQYRAALSEARKAAQEENLSRCRALAGQARSILPPARQPEVVLREAFRKQLGHAKALLKEQDYTEAYAIIHMAHETYPEDAGLAEIHDRLRRQLRVSIPTRYKETAAEFNGRFYAFVSHRDTWSKAQRQCKKMNGHLATVTSRAENDFLYALSHGEGGWLGSTHDPDAETGWSWVTGEPFSFQHWRNDRPATASERAPFLLMAPRTTGSSRGGWMAGHSTQKTPALCEWDTIRPISPQIAQMYRKDADEALQKADRDLDAALAQVQRAVDRVPMDNHVWSIYKRLAYRRADQKVSALAHAFAEARAQDLHGDALRALAAVKQLLATAPGHEEARQLLERAYETYPAARRVPVEWLGKARYAGGRFYALLPQATDWHEAERVCQQLGGHLATIGDAGTNADCAALLQGVSLAWIGLRRDASGDWGWVTGEPLQYTNWDSRPSSSSYSKKRYGALRRGGEWLDSYPANRLCQGMLCEWEAERGTTPPPAANQANAPSRSAPATESKKSPTTKERRLEEFRRKRQPLGRGGDYDPDDW